MSSTYCQPRARLDRGAVELIARQLGGSLEHNVCAPVRESRFFETMYSRPGPAGFQSASCPADNRRLSAGMRILLVRGHAPVTATQLVGALADLGVSPSTFEWELSKVELGKCHLHFDRADPKAHGGVAFSIHGGETHDPCRHGPEHAPGHFASSFEQDTGQRPGHRIDPGSVGGESPRHEHHEQHVDRGIEGPHGHHRLNLGGLRQRVNDSELSPVVKELTLKLLGQIPAGLPADRSSFEAPLSEAEFAVLAPAVLIAVGIEQLKVAAVQMMGELGGSRQVAAASPHADRPFEMDFLVRALHDALPASSSLDGVTAIQHGIGLEQVAAEGNRASVEVALLEI